MRDIEDELTIDYVKSYAAATIKTTRRSDGKNRSRTEYLKLLNELSETVTKEIQLTVAEISATETGLFIASNCDSGKSISHEELKECTFDTVILDEYVMPEKTFTLEALHGFDEPYVNDHQRMTPAQKCNYSTKVKRK